MQSLSKSISLGPVELTIKNREVMREFYHTTLDLDILNEDDLKMSFGKNNTTLVELHTIVDAPSANPSHAGLYHFAILYPSRSALAKTVHKILREKSHLFSGSADHLVSEAFYFNDPEGNGIELYYDRDASQWQWEDNQIKMASLYIDPIEYLQRHISAEVTDAEMKMGHYHLKVGDIQKAHAFYVDILGFDVTARLPGALFISVGGYHHHVGLNTWESAGAGKRTDTLGLKSITFFLQNKKDLLSLTQRLTDNNIVFTQKDSAIRLHDPWNNQIKVVA